eukprot:CAMPEP_0184324398 /NCGR_PEP_ID=MMETSP1049-20130417/134992_1 /TAXON_ID=77928 /ORGANISM="Proteomonas sulcata, Strain CCMP704" /LENGTH=729 /DNA_ID=CAMNT_0026646141 /DNA_START=258 /DNA_END=2447 /DNA_ORIENTATION=-
MYDRTLDRFWNNIMFWWFLVYPAASLATLQTYHCQDLGDGDNYLVADYRVRCPNDDMGGFLFLWALVFVFLYPFGIPLFMFLTMKYFKVDKLAERKVHEALVKATVNLYIQDTTTIEAKRIALAVGNPKDETEFKRRVQTLYQECSSGGGDLEQFVQRLLGSIKGFEPSNSASLLTVLQAYDSDGNGDIDLEEFEDMILKLLSSSTSFLGGEDLLSLNRQQLEALCRHTWPEGVEAPDDVDSSNLEQLIDQIEELKKQELKKLADEGKLNDSLRDLAKDMLEEEEPEEEEEDLSAYSDEELRVRFLEIAKDLQAKQVIALPTMTWSSESPEEEKAVNRMGFLFLAYGIEYWYWEQTEMFRKLLMTSILVFLYEGEPAQLAAGLLITQIALVLTMWLNPFITNGLNSLQAFSLFAQWLTLFVGILIMVNDRSENLDSNNEYSRAVATIVTIMVNSTVVFFPFVRMYMTGKHNDMKENFQAVMGIPGRIHAWCAEKKEEPASDETKAVKVGELNSVNGIMPDIVLKQQDQWRGMENLPQSRNVGLAAEGPSQTLSDLPQPLTMPSQISKHQLQSLSEMMGPANAKDNGNGSGLPPQSDGNFRFWQAKDCVQSSGTSGRLNPTEPTPRHYEPRASGKGLASRDSITPPSEHELNLSNAYSEVLESADGRQARSGLENSYQEAQARATLMYAVDRKPDSHLPPLHPHEYRSDRPVGGQHSTPWVEPGLWELEA